MAQHVLVTGGLGFVGSHVADAYLARGDRVTLVDSLVSAVCDPGDYAALPGCRVVLDPVEDHLRDPAALATVDVVVHTAGLVGPAGILGYAGTLGPRLVGSTHAVLQACLAAEVPVCVFSSAEVYGRSGELAETDDLVVPAGYNARIEYGVAKALVEAMTVNLVRSGLRAVVVRPFNVAGPKQSSRGGFVMPTFVEQALAGQPLTVFDGGQQVRAFVSASDVARFLTDHLAVAVRGPDAIVNLGNPGNATTILGLAERVLRLLGSTSRIVHVSGKAVHGPLYDEARSVVKRPTLAVAARLGWHPEVDLDALVE